MKKGIGLILILGIVVAGCTYGGDEGKTLKTPANPIDKLVFKARVEVIPFGPPHIVSSKTVLDFGKLPHNIIERKEILITNNRNFAVVAIPSANGSISKWLSFDKERIVIEPKGKNSSIVSIRIPEDVKPGNYSGYVVYTFFKKT